MSAPLQWAPILKGRIALIQIITVTRKLIGSRMGNFQDIVFIWIQAYREIFKSALLYLSVTMKKAFLVQNNLSDAWVAFEKGISATETKAISNFLENTWNTVEYGSFPSKCIFVCEFNMWFHWLYTLRKMLKKLHLISWFGSFVERHTFRIVSKTMQKLLSLPRKFSHQEIGWNYGILRSDTYST